MVKDSKPSLFCRLINSHLLNVWLRSQTTDDLQMFANSLGFTSELPQSHILCAQRCIKKKHKYKQQESIPLFQNWVGSENKTARVVRFPSRDTWTRSIRTSRYWAGFVGSSHTPRALGKTVRVYIGLKKTQESFQEMFCVPIIVKKKYSMSLCFIYSYWGKELY